MSGAAGGYSHGQSIRYVPRELMATLRLFANLRETAGTTSVEIGGSTVGEVLDGAVADYGPAFAAGLETAQVWVNGDPADRASPVKDGDEIAVIPPVSGGAVASRSETNNLATVLVLGLAAMVIVGNLASAEAFVVAVVGLASVWMWDLRDTYNAMGKSVQVIPGVLAVAAAANGAYRWGPSGLAGGLAIGVTVVLAWAVLDRTQQTIDTFAIAMLAAITGSVGAGALVVLHLRSGAETGTFLAIAGAGAVAAWLAQRSMSQTGGMDPNVAALMGAIGAGLISGYIADTVDLVNAALAAAVAGGGLIAGRTMGATMRTGQVLHTVRAPGILTPFDGPMMAAGVFWIAIWLLA